MILFDARNIFILFLCNSVKSFLITKNITPNPVIIFTPPLFAHNGGPDATSGSSGDSASERDERLQLELVSRLENLSTIDELQYKVVAARLEEQNLRTRLKARPKFLPLVECKKWVQSWGRRWESEQEWREWIEMGEKVREHTFESFIPFHRNLT
jgi:hypothetical protein